MPTAVAFFRNLNLGQGWAPRRTQLVDAFVRAGATGVDSVQVNGTVVFDHPAPVRAARAVRAALGDLTGYDDAVVVRRAPWLLALVSQCEQRGLGRLEVPVEVGFFDSRPPLGLALPWTSPDGRLHVVAGDHRHAVTTFAGAAGRGSNTTAVLELATGVPVTSRSLGTVHRVADRIRSR